MKEKDFEKHCKPCNRQPGFIPPDMPPFCPPPMPPVPPAPDCSATVVNGMSIWESLQNLNNRVNTCIATYNAVMAENYKTLRNLERAAEENGAYYGYGEVWTEEGYSAEESASYTLIHKACVDRRGEPIRVELHLAYNNTTNSQIEQTIASASKIELADKIVVAQPKREGGWYGKAIYQGCPINTNAEDSLYTVGFTRGGTLKVYHNSVDQDQMLRDTIENAMGCSGVLVQNGELLGEEWFNKIPDYDKQTARVLVGQNPTTKEVIFLTCGNENDVNKKGMTSLNAAKILLKYGCALVVELCEGTASGAMDKGQLLYIPEDKEMPVAYCYWFISRKCHYKNDYERELAILMQNYGETLWQGFLNASKISDLQAALKQEIADRIAADEQLQANIDAEEAARIEADKQLQANIDAEAKAREDADKVLQANIDAEAKAREDADNQLQTNIDQEKTERIAADEKEKADRISADQTLQANIDKETSERKEADNTLQTNIDAERTARIEADKNLKIELQALIDALTIRVTTLEGNVTKLQQLTQTLQEQMAALDTTVSSLQQTISSIETTLNNIKDSITNITNGTTDLPYIKKVDGIGTGTTHLENLIISGDLVADHIEGLSQVTVPVTPSTDSDAASKKYVDDQIAAIPGGGGGDDQFFNPEIDTGNPQLKPELTRLILGKRVDNNGHEVGENQEIRFDYNRTDHAFITRVNGDLIIQNNEDANTGSRITLAQGGIRLESNGEAPYSAPIRNVLAPTDNLDAANKKYVDDLITAVRAEIKGVEKVAQRTVKQMITRTINVDAKTTEWLNAFSGATEGVIGNGTLWLSTQSPTHFPSTLPFKLDITNSDNHVEFEFDYTGAIKEDGNGWSQGFNFEQSVDILVKNTSQYQGTFRVYIVLYE